MKTSDTDDEPRRAALRPGLRALALAAAACPMILASACASQTPPRAEAAASPQPPAASAPPDTASPSSPPSSAAPLSPAPTAASPVPRCTERNLAAGVSRYNAGGGQRGIIITLTNTGTASCSMYGYPGLGLQDANHHVLPSQTHWGPTYFARDPGPSLIMLAPGLATGHGRPFDVRAVQGSATPARSPCQAPTAPARSPWPRPPSGAGCSTAVI
jgi:hypothetical protein